MNKLSIKWIIILSIIPTMATLVLLSFILKRFELLILAEVLAFCLMVIFFCSPGELFINDNKKKEE